MMTSGSGASRPGGSAFWEVPALQTLPEELNQRSSRAVKILVWTVNVKVSTGSRQSQTVKCTSCTTDTLLAPQWPPACRRCMKIRACNVSRKEEVVGRSWSDERSQENWMLSQELSDKHLSKVVSMSL